MVRYNLVQINTGSINGGQVLKRVWNPGYDGVRVSPESWHVPNMSARFYSTKILVILSVIVQHTKFYNKIRITLQSLVGTLYTYLLTKIS